jgi:hypothetical protein
MQEAYKSKGEIEAVLWPESVSQLEYTEMSNVPFEIFKAYCLSKVLKAEYRKYFAEFLKKLGLKSVAQWIGSVYQVDNPMIPENEGSFLRKLRKIIPSNPAEDAYLQYMSFDWKIKRNKPITFLDIKKKPLFHFNNEYRVIDAEFYNQAYYRCLYFNLYYATSLQNEYEVRNRDFTHYTSDMAKRVLEQTCLRTIISVMFDKKVNILQFDDTGKASNPDVYLRKNKTVILIECKGYLFPERIINSLDYEDIKKHIDQRFINNGSSGKGISQIAAQIGHIINGEVEDQDLNANLRFKRLTIYPIICHDEINYHMLGLNAYLDAKFDEKVPAPARDRYSIKPLTLINIRTLYELASRKLTFDEFASTVDRYHGIIRNRTKKETPLFSPLYYDGAVCFEEVYRSKMHPEFVKSHPVSTGRIWTDALGLTQEKLDEDV